MGKAATRLVFKRTRPIVIGEAAWPDRVVPARVGEDWIGHDRGEAIGLDQPNLNHPSRVTDFCLGVCNAFGLIGERRRGSYPSICYTFGHVDNRLRKCNGLNEINACYTFGRGAV
jgi:hypothetical protein